MIRNIVPVTDPVLRKKSKPVEKVDKKIKLLIKDLKDTLKAQKDPKGVGLAACQIGKNLRVFAIKPKKEIKIIINPEVISVSKDKNIPSPKKNVLEGCLSLPHYYGPLKRPKKIEISFLDEDGKKTRETFEGFPAHIIQHEIDHLEGVIFIDKLLKKNLPLFKHTRGEWEEIEL